jgi:pyridoxal phosphate enzyme (YggS family)
VDKIAELRRDRPDLLLEWHFIGPIQSNKTRQIAENFDWVHTIEREKIAHRLAEQRPAHLPPLNVCLQVNISGESTKSGVTPDELLPLAQAVAAMPHLTLRGLMAIPEPAATFEQQCLPFRQLYQLYETLRAQGLPLDTLSMGMSADMNAAIAEGATIVRVGTAIFGKRT